MNYSYTTHSVFEKGFFQLQNVSHNSQLQKHYKKTEIEKKCPEGEGGGGTGTHL